MSLFRGYRSDPVPPKFIGFAYWASGGGVSQGQILTLYLVAVARTSIKPETGARVS